jgi:hypothetical protein
VEEKTKKDKRDRRKRSKEESCKWKEKRKGREERRNSNF